MQQPEKIDVGMVERGVYWARYTKRGKRILYAVDSKSDIVKRLILQDDSDRRAKAAIEFLWNHLDVVDPSPESRRSSIHIVREFPSPHRRATIEDYDPYNLPPLPYHRR